jgi:hypothetical protein
MANRAAGLVEQERAYAKFNVMAQKCAPDALDAIIRQERKNIARANFFYFEVLNAKPETLKSKTLKSKPQTPKPNPKSQAGKPAWLSRFSHFKR